MEDIEEIDKEIQRIYSLYNINFITKLDKEIYYSDVFIPNYFNVNQLCGSLFIRVKRTINLKTHKLI
jgi:hypothetical protein